VGVAPVTIRPAESHDVPRIVDIMHGQPGREAVALAGNEELARRFGRAYIELEKIPNAEKPTVVACAGDETVGVLQYTYGQQADRFTLAHVRLALRVLGPVGVVRGIPRLRARSKVDLPIPAGSFYIAEIHVDPRVRGQGVGGALLDWADGEAHRLGASKMSLTTTTANPARHLYERKGFAITKRATDKNYERYTGIEGRVLMEKDLTLKG
jgi:ribosomal protein S18 acetylase RimI-like enzyme